MSPLWYRSDPISSVSSTGLLALPELISAATAHLAPIVADDGSNNEVITIEIDLAGPSVAGEGASTAPVAVGCPAHVHALHSQSPPTISIHSQFPSAEFKTSRVRVSVSSGRKTTQLVDTGAVTTTSASKDPATTGKGAIWSRGQLPSDNQHGHIFHRGIAPV